MTATNHSASVSYLFTFKCPDRLGILAKTTGLLYDNGAFVCESSHYSDPDTEMFFARMVFKSHVLKVSLDQLNELMAGLAAELDMEFSIRSLEQRPKIMLAVSKYDHCLNVLLTKWRSNALEVDIVGVVSNHDDCRGLVEWYGIPYHHLPVTPATKSAQEQQILQLMNDTDAEMLVLARYMQILSDDLCRALNGRAINIHHSFLPGFKGAKPYHQAHERGVKIIGATAHYVTSDLDEGPIIVQEVRAIDHKFRPQDMVLVGHDTESIALSHAVRLHCDGRVFMNGHRTVIL
ncbi:formyltetrahydrofolate deformylase [Pseudomonas sp. P115]|uniref:formyltetrahydrofolate deformylase n=1 Tax=Pseudomonas pisciculturae TaxID=2730413 RepID=UPI0018926295|nr:formyltetrahydrofolate deformylase [Pseudomonas pisciculturae]MBF6029815.1 formyltetrahydrofolate deformylase [Pseudomonas pisciculturae]